MSILVIMLIASFGLVGCVRASDKSQKVGFEDVPNEVLRMFFESMSFKQRRGVQRVAKLWRFLCSSFPPSISKSVFIEQADDLKNELNNIQKKGNPVELVIRDSVNELKKERLHNIVANPLVTGLGFKKIA